MLFQGDLDNKMRRWLGKLKSIITGRIPISQQKKLEAVSIAITVVHGIMFFMFVQFNVWPMIIYNGIVVAYYLYILKTVHVGYILTGYIMTFVEIAVQVILGTFMLGWDVGFFMYVFAIIPLFFYLNLLNDNIEGSVLPPLFSTLGAVLVFIASYVVSIVFEPRFVLEKYQIHILFIYNSVLSILLLAAMSHFFIIERRFSLLAITNENKKLDVEASEDPLTGLTNRRSMERHLDNAMLEARARGRIFSLIMGDIDFFKSINDSYGHDFGDEALKMVSEVLKSSVRDGDIICRWGGEEFLILIYGTEKDAEAVAERIRKTIEDDKLIHNDKEVRFTITLGVSTYKPGFDMEKLIARADDRLYYGKRNGRNQVVTSEIY